MLLCSLDLAVNVALPDIAADFAAGMRATQWIIVVYVGGSASLQLGLGSAADAYGLKRFYIVGVAAYLIAVALIGVAPSLSAALGLRFAQAVGNTLILATAPALVTAAFPAERRGTALGLMTGVGTLGMIIATLGGGVLVDAFGWRAIFLARVPLALIAIALAVVLIDGRFGGRRAAAGGANTDGGKAGKAKMGGAAAGGGDAGKAKMGGAAADGGDANGGNTGKAKMGGANVGSARSGGAARGFDVRGAALAFVGFGALILFMTIGGGAGWTTPMALALGAVAALALALFLWWEGRAALPALDPRMLRHPVIAAALAALFLMSMATFVNLFILPFYASEVLGVNAKALGFLLMLSPAAAAVAAPAGGWLSDRMSAARLGTGALALCAGALFWFSALTAESGIADVAVRMALLGVGMGVFQAASATLIMGATPSDRLGSGGSLFALSRSLATAASVSLLSALFAARLATHSAAQPDGAQAFALAFGDAYMAAGALCAAAVCVSAACWPEARRRVGGMRRG